MKVVPIKRILFLLLSVIVFSSCKRNEEPDLKGLGLLLTGDKEYPVLVNYLDGTHIAIQRDTLNGEARGIILSKKGACDVYVHLDERGFPWQVLWGDSIMLVLPDQKGSVRVAMLRPGKDTLYSRDHTLDEEFWQFQDNQLVGNKSVAFWDPNLEMPDNIAHIMQITGMSISVVSCLAALLNPAGMIALSAICGTALVDILMTFDKIEDDQLVNPQLEDAWFATSALAGIHECMKGTLTTHKEALISCIGLMVSTWQKAVETWAVVSHRQVGWITDSRLALLGEPERLQVVSGNQQHGLIGTVLRQPVWVEVVDAFGTGIAGIDVTFATQTSLTIKTNQDGLASILWKMPETPGVCIMTVTAQSKGSVIKDSPLTLTATAVEEESFYPSVWKMYNEEGYSGTLTFVDEEVVTWDVIDQLLTRGTYSLLVSTISFTIHAKQPGSGYDFNYYFTGQVQDSTMQGNVKLLIDDHSGEISPVYGNWSAKKSI